MSALRTLGLERRGRGVSVALRKLIILLLLGSVLGEGGEEGGGGRGKLDFVFVNKLSFTQNEVCAVCFVPRTDTRGQNTAGQGKDGVLITMLLELAFWLPGPPRGLAR